MNHTPNYQLNQWSADDRVQRVDFNADNAKIDAALAGLEGARRSDLLGVYQFPAGGTQLNLSLTAFDLSKYVSLEVRVSRLTAATETNLICTLNGLRDIYHNTQNGARALDTLGSFKLVEQRDGTGQGGTQVIIELSMGALGGSIQYIYAPSFNHSQPFAYPDKIDWGVHPKDLATDQLASFNVVSNAPVTGGKVFLIGHRF